MILYANEKIRREIFDLIKATSSNRKIEKLLTSFIVKELKFPSYRIDLSQKCMRSRYCSSIRSFINFIGRYSSNDINWSNFCISLENIRSLNRWHIPLVDHLFREFYKYALENIQVINTDIMVLTKFKHFLDIPERPRIKTDTNIRFSRNFGETIRNVFCN